MRHAIKIYEGLVNALAIVAGLALAVIFLLILQDATLRNLRISPPAWSAPIAEYALLYVTMLAAPWLVRTRGHIALQVLRQQLPPEGARRLEYMVYIFCIAICAVLSWQAIDLFLSALQSGEQDYRGIDIPKTWLYGPAAVAFPLMTCEFARYLFGPESYYSAGPATGDGV